MKFKNRFEAGQQLAFSLNLYENKNVMVVAIAKGGIITAFPVIKKYAFPWDLLVIRKLGISFNKDIPLGSITTDGSYYLDHYMINKIENSKDSLKKEMEHEKKETQRRMRKFRNSDIFPKVNNKTVILIDDGIVTGYTMFAAIDAIKKHGAKKIVIAVPIAPDLILQSLESHVDDIICLFVPDPFISIGTYYKHFEHVSDEEVYRFISQSKNSSF